MPAPGDAADSNTVHRLVDAPARTSSGPGAKCFVGHKSHKHVVRVCGRESRPGAVTRSGENCGRPELWVFMEQKLDDRCAPLGPKTHIYEAALVPGQQIPARSGSTTVGKSPCGSSRPVLECVNFAPNLEGGTVCRD